VYKSFKAVTGLGDPLSQRLQQKNVQGVLKDFFGSSPKFGAVQRKLISSQVDNVGRAVITPNPDLDMDTVGLPEDSAFDVYSKFLARRFRRQGMPLTQALQQIRDRTPLARKLLVEEMSHRPVFINRAPVLHKFGIMAFWPRLVSGSTMQVSPTIVKGFNADFDGDAMQFHVPTTEDARKEAIERMLPSRSLFSLADFETPMHMPANEYVAGLYNATSEPSKRPLQIFRTMKDLREAYARGAVNMNDPVKVLEH
jgi:DNA-directed RNA polymerase subunit beta'